MMQTPCSLGGGECTGIVQWNVIVRHARTNVPLHSEYVCDTHMQKLDVQFANGNDFRTTFIPHYRARYA